MRTGREEEHRELSGVVERGDMFCPPFFFYTFVLRVMRLRNGGKSWGRELEAGAFGKHWDG